MQEFLAWLSRILNSWKFWIVIAPWEIGVLIRLGKRAMSLVPGLHWRIPFIDIITLVNTRLRIDATPPITIQGNDSGKTKYMSAVIGYQVFDPLKAMLQFGLPQAIIVSKAQSELASTGGSISATREALQSYFNSNTGISISFVELVENVEVKTYRIIEGSSWIRDGHETVGADGAVGGRY